MIVKKLISFITVLCLMLSLTGFCFAANPVIESQTVEVETLEDGTEVETIFTVYENFSRASFKTASVKKNYKDAYGDMAASVTLVASFAYDGNIARVESAYSEVSEYNNWNYENERISETGNTAKLTAKLTKSGEGSKNVSLSISCSPNGVLTKN